MTAATPLVVVLTLALTIGASTAVFAIVNGILLKPLAYDEAHRLVVVNGTAQTVVGVLPADVKIPIFSQLIGPGQLATSAAVFVPLRLNVQNISPIGEFNYAVVDG